jgi:ammonia channel protein AmtB
MTLIAGWYGMNTANLPAANRPWGWVVVTAVMAVVGLVSWLYFARLGLVGQPRLIKPIGKGLAAAARAPMKPVTMLRRDLRR